VQSDGSRWKRSDQTRPIKDALKKAGLPLDGSIYALRHTHVSHAIEGGVPLNAIAENCGYSVRMIEKTYAKILAEKGLHRTGDAIVFRESSPITPA
jgi:site-specific recombinase XerD